MNFKRNQLVEVRMDEEGLKHCYYEERIMRTFPATHICHVQFEELFADNKTEPLRELISMDSLLPTLPNILVFGFEEGDVVDAKLNDGWWRGKLFRKEEDGYVVHFEEFDED